MSDKRTSSAPLQTDRTFPTSTESETAANGATPTQSQAPAVNTRPAGCQAAPIGDHMMCNRCGAAWPVAKPQPCRPMTYARMIVTLIEQAERHEASAEAVMALVRNGMPGSPAPALAHAAELRAIARVIDLVRGDSEVKNMLAERGRGTR